LLVKLLKILSRQDRWLAIWVLFLAIVLSAAEVAGIGSIVAYVRIVADPSLISSSQILSQARETLGSSSDTDFLTYSGLGLIFVIIFRNIVGAASLFFRTYFAQTMIHRLSYRRMRHYLEQRYEAFLTLNTGELRKNLLVEVAQLTSGYLVAGIMVFSNALTVIAILAFLLWQEPMVTGLAVLSLGSIYVCIYLLIRYRSTWLGHQGRIATEQAFRTTDEAFRGIKELKLQGGENYFSNLFWMAAKRLSRIGIGKVLIAQLPRYLIETVVFVGLLAVVLSTLDSEGRSSDSIAIIALFAMAGYRLIPLLSQLFQSISQMRTSYAVAKSLVEEFSSAATAPVTTDQQPPPPLPFFKEITLDQVSYHYPSEDTDVIDNISLVVEKGSSIAFVGATGAGKSTLVETIMGLLVPTNGKVLIDDVILTHENLRAWQQQVAYVPQHVHYLDDSITQNIAFAVSYDEIDTSSVIEAAKKAHIHDFIVGDLPDGYDTRLGESGVRFSGGQLQRLAIARALYRRPQLLVLDEATSSLDNVTESIVTETIRDLAGTITTVTIAHRLHTVQFSDAIHIIEGGRIVATGSYEYLVSNSESFKAMAGKLP